MENKNKPFDFNELIKKIAADPVLSSKEHYLALKKEIAAKREALELKDTAFVGIRTLKIIRERLGSDYSNDTDEQLVNKLIAIKYDTVVDRNTDEPFKIMGNILVLNREDGKCEYVGNLTYNKIEKDKTSIILPGTEHPVDLKIGNSFQVFKSDMIRVKQGTFDKDNRIEKTK